MHLVLFTWLLPFIVLMKDKKRLLGITATMRKLFLFFQETNKKHFFNSTNDLLRQTQNLVAQ